MILNEMGLNPPRRRFWWWHYAWKNKVRSTYVCTHGEKGLFILLN